METETKNNNNENSAPLRLDISIESPQERNELVKKIIAEAPPSRLTPQYLKILSDYIIFAMDKEERKKKNIITDNRMITLNKHETSYQGLVSKLENGEDGIYNMSIAEDKNIIFAPKAPITEKDIEEIPALKELVDSIKKIEILEKAATGKRKYLLNKQLIELRQDQYEIKKAYKKPIYCINKIKSITKINLSEKITIDPETKDPISDGYVSFFNPKHISAILCNYCKLKEDSWGKLESDSYYMMEDFDALVDRTLKEKYPLYYDLLIFKIDGKSNIEIQSLLNARHGIIHSVEYISSLWRNKIPKLISDKACEEYLIWYYTFQEYGHWKKCSRCGQIKLAHNRFFSKNKTAKDGFYSICKDCRNSQNKIAKEVN